MSHPWNHSADQVYSEKHELTENAKRLVKTIRQMEASLDDTKVRDDYDAEDSDMRVTYPLLSCIEGLKQKHNTISKLHRERFEQVKKLVEALQSYASHLEPSFISVKLPPTSPNSKVPPTFDLSPTYVAALDNEFTRVYEEYNKRIVTVTTLADEIIHLWGELGTPQAQVDSAIVQHGRDAPEQLGLHQEDLARLQAKRDKLIEEKRGREKKLRDLKTTVEGLWNMLNVDEAERKQFMASNRGCGLRTINEFEDELSRLNELKRQNLHIFVEDARFKIQELWDSLYYSEEEMLEFTPAFSDVYSDALLSAHENEISRLEALKEQRAPTLALIDKHRSIIKDREDLAASSQDASRLMMRGQKGEKRDPTRLLREEKMRKRIAKELPKVEVELRKILESWENEYGRPFLVHGQRYLDELDAPAPKPAPTTSRAKTPSNPPPPARTTSARTAPPASRNGTMRGPPPPRSKTPTASIGRNPLSSSVMAPSSTTSTFASSVSHGSTLRSPSKIPARAPLSNLTHGHNSPERRPRTAMASHGRDENTSTIKSRPGAMGPPASTASRSTRVPPPKIKDYFAQPPPTPTPTSAHDMNVDRSASIVRHVDPEDVYDDNAPSYQRGHHSTHSAHSITSSASTTSRPASVLHHYQPHHQQAASLSESVSSMHSYRPSPALKQASRFEGYPLAPTSGISRQTSNTSSVITSQSHASSAVSGSENWETYTDNSDVEDGEPEPDARDAYYAKLRTHGGMKVAPPRMIREATVEGSDSWSDVGETF